MAEKRAFYRSWIFYLLSGIILTAGLLIWRHIKYKFVDKKIDQLVTGKSKGLYQVNYHNLNINEAAGSIYADGVELLPDTAVYQTMVAEGKAPQSLFFIRIPELEITGVKTPKALLQKEISAHLVRIKNANIELRLGKTKKDSESDFKKNLGAGLYRQLLGSLNSIKADSIVLENATLTLMDKEDKVPLCKATGLSIRFAGISIDSTDHYDSSRILFSENLNIHCDHFDYPTKDKLYQMLVSGVNFDSKSGDLHLDQFNMIPRLSEEAFAQKFHFSKDRFHIEIGNLDIFHLQKQKILLQEIFADSMVFSQSSIKVYRDISHPHDSVDRTTTYPNQAIMKLPMPAYISKLIFKDCYIEYKEKNAKSDSSGKVAFFHVWASLKNVTNMPDSIRKRNQMILNFQSAFLNKSKFTAEIKMKLNDPQGNFTLDAHLDQISAADLNPLLKPMALAELEKGEIKSLHYQLTATNKKGKGTLLLNYDNLKIKLLKKDEDKNKYKTKFFPTLAAGLLIKESNPQHGKMRTGNVDYERDIHRSIFNFMWKSLFANIKDVVK